MVGVVCLGKCVLLSTPFVVYAQSVQMLVQAVSGFQHVDNTRCLFVACLCC